MFPVLNKLGAAMDDIAEQTAVQIRKELDQKGISTCFAKFSSEIKQISTQLDNLRNEMSTIPVNSRIAFKEQISRMTTQLELYKSQIRQQCTETLNKLQSKELLNKGSETATATTPNRNRTNSTPPRLAKRGNDASALETKKMLEEELKGTGEAYEMIDATSKTLNSISSIHSDVGDELKISKRLVSFLKINAVLKKKFFQLSVCFFFAVFTWIVLRRIVFHLPFVERLVRVLLRLICEIILFVPQKLVSGFSSAPLPSTKTGNFTQASTGINTTLQSIIQQEL